MKRFDRFDYPPHDGYRDGCKVAWHYYRRKADAVKAAKVAKQEAAYKAEQGYDFGYLSPGWQVLKMGPGAPFAGMYEVCVP